MVEVIALIVMGSFVAVFMWLDRDLTRYPTTFEEAEELLREKEEVESKDGGKEGKVDEGVGKRDRST